MLCKLNTLLKATIALHSFRRARWNSLATWWWLESFCLHSIVLMLCFFDLLSLWDRWLYPISLGCEASSNPTVYFTAWLDDCVAAGTRLLQLFGSSLELETFYLLWSVRHGSLNLKLATFTSLTMSDICTRRHPINRLLQAQVLDNTVIHRSILIFKFICFG